jgi:hypothetical protein
MNQLKLAMRAVALMVMISLCQWSTGASQVRKDKDGVTIPDIQLLTIQFLDRPKPDDPGQIQPAIVTGMIRNNTDDRVITGILWKIQIKDAKTLKVVEVLHPYTYEDRTNTMNKMKITPHASVKVAFYIARTVHTEHTRETTIEAENYVYTPYDKARDKPVSIESYVPEQWPFKSHTEPVLQEPGKH